MQCTFVFKEEYSMPRTVLTYGTFDLFHIGHLRLLSRARDLGDRLIVGVSTDEFNVTKSKKTVVGFEDRIEIVRSVRYVDEAFAESSWEQKIEDIKRYNVDTFVMGRDWEGKFDFLKSSCHVVYLPRTDDISSTSLKLVLWSLSETHIDSLKRASETIAAIVASIE
jgi:glycerol-3-phosphate cytidylyltransferase